HVDGCKERFLLITALHVFAKSRVRIDAQARCRGESTVKWTDCRQTIRAPVRGAKGFVEIGPVALRDPQVVEVHVVIDDELLPVEAREPPDAVVGIGGEAQLMA